MGRKTTFYKSTFDLSEFDMRNIEFLEEKTGQNKTSVVHTALHFCQYSLEQRARGNVTGIIYETFDYRATSGPVSHESVAARFNARSSKAQRNDVSMYRSTAALEAIEDIKKSINTESDSVAVAYALEYSAAAVRALQAANNGKKARFFFSHDNSPRSRGMVFNKHPFDISMAESFRKASRRMKANLGKLVPGKKALPMQQEEKREPQLPKTPAPAAATETPTQQTPAADVGAIHNGIANDMKGMKPVTFKQDGKKGFSL